MCSNMRSALALALLCASPSRGLHLACQRRRLLAASLAALPAQEARAAPESGLLVEVADPQTYSALAYAPPGARGKPLPLLVVLHGAGRNEAPLSSLADPSGEHGGLLPSLIAAGRAPAELLENFAVVAPYSAGSRSFYEEPRRKLLQFIDWACSDAGREAGCAAVDRQRIFLFGFSDGATVAVELATTRRFAAAVVAACGLSGELPALATQRLAGLPLWFFHSADDSIFSVGISDRLVRALRLAGGRPEAVRYTRLGEGGARTARAHVSTGATASQSAEVYRWLLAQSPAVVVR